MSSTRAPSDCIASTVRTTMPFCAPTRPACAPATTPARASANKTGTQSAVTTAKAKRRLVVTKASVLSIGSPPAFQLSSMTATLLLCT